MMEQSRILERMDTVTLSRTRRKTKISLDKRDVRILLVMVPRNPGQIRVQQAHCLGTFYGNTRRSRNLYKRIQNDLKCKITIVVSQFNTVFPQPVPVRV